MGALDDLANVIWNKLRSTTRLFTSRGSKKKWQYAVIDRSRMIGLHEGCAVVLRLENDEWSTKHQVCITARDGTEEDLTQATHLSAHVHNGKTYVSYTRPDGARTRRVFAVQNAKKPESWRIISSRNVSNVCGSLHTSAEAEQFVGCYTREKAIYPVYGTSVQGSTCGVEPIITARGEDPDPNRPTLFFDHNGVEALGAFGDGNNLLILYQSPAYEDGKSVLHIGGARFVAAGNSWHQTWRSEVPLETFPVTRKHARTTHVLGAVSRGEAVDLFWEMNGDIHIATIHHPFADLDEDDNTPLRRHHQNPVIAANPEQPWEAAATFNPAAVLIDDDVHLLYRALSHSGRSVVGHAVSEDGLSFARSKTPAYVPTDEAEGVGVPSACKTPDYRSPSTYGVDGAEDPRATVLEDRVHMMYAAFNGYEQARTAGVSISVDDFRNKRFYKWGKRTLLTPPPTRWGMGGKNAALMPGKRDNSYVIFHRIWPDICIDYTRDSDLSEFEQEDRWLTAHSRIGIRPSYWDSGKVAIGPPPIEIDEGWLLIYTGVSQQLHDGYKIGAMILDKNNPAKVLYRATRPVLSPRTWYERSGLVPNVAYPCGAVIKDDTLFVYYGGADTYVCVASSPLNEFVEYVKQNTPTTMTLRKAEIKTDSVRK